MDEFDQMKIRRIDGGLLLVFQALLARRRAAAVADQLGLSPSAISHALARLRDLFGDPLFIRRSHGLEPTQKAIELGPRIDTLIGMIGETVSPDPGFDPARSRRRFRIACGEDIASLIGDRLVTAFREQAPRAHFTTRWAILEPALRALRRGEIDLALGVFNQIPAGFVASLLYADEYCVIARADHPQVRGAVDLATYARIGHIFVGNPDGALVDEAPWDRDAINAAYGPLPGPDVVRTNAYVSLWETAMLIVSQTDALADCPARLARRYAGRLGLQILAPPFEPFRFQVQAVRRSQPADPGADWLLARIAEAVEAA
jgi:DNA-binding transcriptional LysR family regulator